MKRIFLFSVLFCGLLMVIVHFLGYKHTLLIPKLKEISFEQGYRFGVIRNVPSKDNNFVALAFSGGGIRAAAFSFGVMEGLKTIEYNGTDHCRHRLLDDVEMISSVSGGSFTSAYYVLYPETFFEEFPKRVLYKNIELELISRLFYPKYLWRFFTSDFSRSDMASEFYDEEIFQKATFQDLLKKPKGSRPFLILNATDMVSLQGFEFVQDHFDHMCLDLANYPLSRAVAGSACFPFAFAPLTVPINKESCGTDSVLDTAANMTDRPKQQIIKTNSFLSYRDPDQKFVHLLDGGLADNLGMRALENAVDSPSSPGSPLRYTGSRIENPFFIVVNARAKKNVDWGKTNKHPNVIDVFSMIADSPIDTVSFDEIEKLNSEVKNSQHVSNLIKAFTKYDFSVPDTKVVELSFDDVGDEALARCLQEIPTRLNLSKQDVDLLRDAGKYILFRSKSFNEAMVRIDASWRPITYEINKNLIANACKHSDRQE